MSTQPYELISESPVPGHLGVKLPTAPTPPSPRRPTNCWPLRAHKKSLESRDPTSNWTESEQGREIRQKSQPPSTPNRHTKSSPKNCPDFHVRIARAEKTKKLKFFQKQPWTDAGTGGFVRCQIRRAGGKDCPESRCEQRERLHVGNVRNSSTASVGNSLAVEPAPA